MKKILPTLATLTLLTNLGFAGNWFGPGPFANGAFFPGQYDGVYTASMFGGSPSVVSGVLGFGLRNGAPSTSTNSTSTNSISVDPNQNFFVAFIDGVTYSGLTVGSLNNQENSVNGGLFNGIAPSFFSVLVTTNNPGTSNQIVTITQLEQQRTAGGAFLASLTGKKATITFSGNNTGIISPNLNGIPQGSSTFSLNGMKVGNQTTTTQ